MLSSGVVLNVLKAPLDDTAIEQAAALTLSGPSMTITAS